MKRFFVKASLAVAVGLAATPAYALQTLKYEILKEGEPIGVETVRIDEKGDKTHVEVRTKTDVKVLFLEFHYQHKREEVWQGDELVSVTAETNDDGSLHNYVLNRAGDAWVLKGSDGDKAVEKEALPLSLWSKAVLNKPVLLSVIDAQPYKVKTVSMGEDHYRIEGDIERELWFAKDGYLEKVAFKRKGFLIEFLRK